MYNRIIKPFGIKRGLHAFAGFTLAEMMVVMLILSIVMAAMAPVVTTRNKRDQSNSSPWKYTGTKNEAYYGTQDNNTALIGQNSFDDTDPLAKLLIKASETKPAHIGFKTGDNVLGVLQFGNSGMVLGQLKEASGEPGTPGATSAGTLGTSSLAIGNGLNASGNNSIVIGLNSSSTGANSIVLGNTTAASGENAIAIGNQAKSSKNSIGIGSNALKSITSGEGNIAIGQNALQGNTISSNNIAIGTEVNGDNGFEASDTIAIGHTATAGSNYGIAIGSNTQATEKGIAIGYQAETDDYSIAIGSETLAYTNSIAIGNNSNSSDNCAENSIILGNNNTLKNSNEIVIGSNMTAEGENAIAIGNVELNGENSIAIGGKKTFMLDEPKPVKWYAAGQIGLNGNLEVGHIYYTCNAIGANTTKEYCDNIIRGVMGIDGTSFPATNTYYDEDDNTFYNYEPLIANNANMVIPGGLNDKKLIIDTNTPKWDDLPNKTKRDIIYVAENYYVYNIQIPLLNDSDAGPNFFNSAHGFDFSAQLPGDSCNVYSHNGKSATFCVWHEIKYNTISVEAKYNNYNVDFYSAATTSDCPTGDDVSADQASIFNIMCVADWKTQDTLKTKVEHKNSAAIGAGAKTTKENQIVLGVYNDEVLIPGKLVVENGITTYGFNNYSDRRLKYVGEEFTSGLDKIRQLKVFNYTFKKDREKTPRVGVMAQDLQKVFPDAVKKGNDGFLTIRMEDMFYAVINAIKELDTKITELINEVKQLRKETKALELRIKKLESK